MGIGRLERGDINRRDVWTGGTALSSIVRLALVLFDYPRCTVAHRPGSIIRPSLYFTCNNRNGRLNNGITGLNPLIVQELSRAYAIFKRTHRFTITRDKIPGMISILIFSISETEDGQTEVERLLPRRKNLRLSNFLF